jgi:hypothetical protein
MGELLQQQLDCDTPGLLEWQRDGRQMGCGHGSHRDVVEADDADLVGHADAAIREPA